MSSVSSSPHRVVSRRQDWKALLDQVAVTLPLEGFSLEVPVATGRVHTFSNKRDLFLWANASAAASKVAATCVTLGKSILEELSLKVCLTMSKLGSQI